MGNNKNPSYVDNTTSNPTGKDVTKDFEVDKSEVDIYSIDELVPNSSPLTIPYLEIYRTNELEYVPYLSPYNVGVSSDTSSDSSSSSNTSTNGTDGSSTGTDNSTTGTDGSTTGDSSSTTGSSDSSSTGNQTTTNP